MKHEKPKVKYLTRQRAAEYVTETWGISLSPLTLDKWASQNSGPPYAKFNQRRCYYDPADLDAWIVSKTGIKFRSTSHEAWLKKKRDDDKK